jgi:hypothetical protein
MGEQDKNGWSFQINGNNDAKWGQLNPEMLQAVVQCLQSALAQAETLALDLLDEELDKDNAPSQGDIPEVLEAIMAAYHKYK